VIHVWVDPAYGDDAKASGSQGPPGNPSPQVNCLAHETKPNHVVDPSQSGKILLNAPYPFKTITAALLYIPPLPYSFNHPLIPNLTITWRFGIVHLLPGVYSPRGPGARHPANGLITNNETFPIHVPPNVSIQGTSALNTIIDLGADLFLPGPAFEFGVILMTPNGPLPINGVNTFIDSVSIYGAQIQVTDQPWRSCAIYIGGAVASRPTISNCWIFRNWVGIMVAAGGEPDVVHDGTMIVNNTIALNRIGLWNGEWPVPVPPGDVSFSGSYDCSVRALRPERTGSPCELR
jgi:hypothetical protein